MHAFLFTLSFVYISVRVVTSSKGWSPFSMCFFFLFLLFGYGRPQLRAGLDQGCLVGRIDPTHRVRALSIVISRSFQRITLSTLVSVFRGWNVHDGLHDWHSHDFSFSFFLYFFFSYRRAYRPPWLSVSFRKGDFG